MQLIFSYTGWLDHNIEELPECSDDYAGRCAVAVNQFVTNTLYGRVIDKHIYTMDAAEIEKKGDSVFIQTLHTRSQAFTDHPRFAREFVPTGTS